MTEVPLSNDELDTLVAAIAEYRDKLTKLYSRRGSRTNDWRARRESLLQLHLKLTTFQQRKGTC